MTKEKPRVTVKFYATLRTKAGMEETSCRAATLRDVLNFLKKNYGSGFNTQLASCHIFVNSHNAAHLNGPGTKLREGDILHLLPPTGGG